MGFFAAAAVCCSVVLLLLLLLFLLLLPLLVFCCCCCCCCNCCCCRYRWFCCCYCLGPGLLLRRGWAFFSPLFRGSPPLFGYFSPALLIVLGLDLTRALGLRFFGDGGGRRVLCCCCCCCRRRRLIFRSLGAELGDVSNLLTPPAPGASSLHHHHHLPIPADQHIRDGFEAIPGQAQPEGIIPVGCPGRGSEEAGFLDESVGA